MMKSFRPVPAGECPHRPESDFLSVAGRAFVTTYVRVPLLCLAGALLATAVHGSEPSYGWLARFGGAGSLGTHVCRVTTDHADNIYMTGNFLDPTDLDPSTNVVLHTGRNEAFVAAWGPAPDYRWSVSFGDPTSTHSKQAEGCAIAVDNAGRVFVAGNIIGNVDLDPGPGVDIHTNVQGAAFLQCFNVTNGNLLWARSIHDWYAAEAYGVAADTNGGVYMAGWFGPGTFDLDPTAGVDVRTNPATDDNFNSGYVIKLHNDGSYRWARIFGGLHANTECYDVDVTSAGDCYAVGGLRASAGTGGTVDFDDGAGTNLWAPQLDDAFLVALNATGGVRWVRAWGGSGRDYAVEVAVTEAGVVVAGVFAGIVDFDPGPGVVSRDAADGSHFAVMYSHEGEFQWVYTFPAELEM